MSHVAPLYLPAHQIWESMLPRNPDLILLSFSFNNLEGARGGIPNVGSQESCAEPAPMVVKAGLAETQ